MLQLNRNQRSTLLQKRIRCNIVVTRALPPRPRLPLTPTPLPVGEGLQDRCSPEGSGAWSTDCPVGFEAFSGLQGLALRFQGQPVPLGKRARNATQRSNCDNLFGTLSHSAASAGASIRVVITGQTLDNSALSAMKPSWPAGTSSSG